MQIAIMVLVGVIIYQGIIHQLDKREAVRRESELLNRVMARDYGEYVMAKVREKAADKPEQPQEELGIPV